jgi:hypothetical protein
MMANATGRHVSGVVGAFSVKNTVIDAPPKNCAVAFVKQTETVPCSQLLDIAVIGYGLPVSVCGISAISKPSGDIGCVRSYCTVMLMVMLSPAATVAGALMFVICTVP